MTISLNGTTGITTPDVVSSAYQGGPLAGFRNVIINGNFDTWQRGFTTGSTMTAPASGAYTADRFLVVHSSDAVVDVIKAADAPTAAQAGVYTDYCYQLDITTADATIAAGQYYLIRHHVEGLNAKGFGFGQAGTRNVTLSFWHKHTVVGTYCVVFQNSAGNRSYIAEYSQAVTDTWEEASITVPVDTSGTWLYTNGIGLTVAFVVAAGSDWQSTAGSWLSTNDWATSSQVNGLSSTANNFKIAQVQLEAGSVATPFESRPIGTELALCQRYLPVVDADSNSQGFIGVGYSYTTSVSLIAVPFKVTPRVVPTGIEGSSVTTPAQINVATGSGTQGAATNVVASYYSLSGALLGITGTGTPFTAGQGSYARFNGTTGQIRFTGCEL